jgi:hypothetical protein
MDLTVEAIAEGKITAAELAALLQGNTYATLLVEHEHTMVPLSKLAEPIFGLNEERAKTLAKADSMPLPVFKLGGLRSPWMVHLADLAQLIDTQRAAAAKRLPAVLDEAPA